MASLVNNWLALWVDVSLTDKDLARSQLAEKGFSWPDRQKPLSLFDRIFTLDFWLPHVPGTTSPQDYGSTWDDIWERRPSQSEMDTFNQTGIDRPEVFQPNAGQRAILSASNSLSDFMSKTFGESWKWLAPYVTILAIGIAVYYGIRLWLSWRK